MSKEDKYNNIINEIKHNNFLENVEIDYKIQFMLKTIDIIITETINEQSKWKLIYDEYKVGYYNKAISEMCLNNINEALINANNAKKYIMTINKDNENKMNYNMYKYNECINQINKLNLIIRQLSNNLLKEDKYVSEIDSDSDSDKKSD
tara:strand:- start:10955 stop:11401 length:447 start_codon:yes stop_codon:yes gene_type:complete